MERLLCVCLSVTFVGVFLSRTTESRCVDVPVEYCRRLGFTGTYFPNHFYHRSISEAVAAFNQFISAEGECSDNFGKFVCAAYFPGCTLTDNRRVDISFNPCRKLCNSVFKPCKLSFRRLKIRWPSELRCGSFPTKECIDVMDELVPVLPTTPPPSTPTPTVATTTEFEPRCEPLKITTCRDLGYNSTIMPNMLGHNLQEDVQRILPGFIPLIQYGCSEALKPFVCALYAPSCSENYTQATPCRSFCEVARHGCQPVLKLYGFDWPEDLACTELPEENCYTGGFSASDINITESRCVDVPVEYCRRLGFTGTYFPNHFYHRSISEAVSAFNRFTSPEGICSDNFGKFLCAAYFPGCIFINNTRVDMNFNPCPNLCRRVSNPCRSSFRRLKFWPHQLRCGSFPTTECTMNIDELVPPLHNVMPSIQPRTIVPRDCEPINYSSCQDVGYDQTMLPNRFNQTDPVAVAEELDQFNPLIQIQCSNALQPFLCVSYFPPCLDSESERTPCRSLCEAAKEGCVQMMRMVGYDWPEHLNCSSLPDDNCFDAGFRSGDGTDTDTSLSPTIPVQVGMCETLTIPLCQDLGYTQTMIPNFVGHTLQNEADIQLRTYSGLIRSQCSTALKPFLCAIYAPRCSDGAPEIPCRSFCEAARDDCLPNLQASGFSWPEHLNCAVLPNDNCYKIESSGLESPCEPLTIGMCQDLNYNSTLMPNKMGHNSQSEVELILQSFTPLIQYGCSSALKPFLCAVYAPSCSEHGTQVTPCRSFCEMARNDCQSVLETFGFNWPASLECTDFPEEKCYDGGFTTTEIPDATGTYEEPRCEPLTIGMCQDLNYNSTMMPNQMGHSLQSDAELLLQSFTPLIQYGCSSALKPFLCAVYAPSCSENDIQATPCRSFCEMARKDCQSVLESFGFNWPASLECTEFPEQNCYDGGFLGGDVPYDKKDTNEEPRCEPLTIGMCQDLNYNSTIMPNQMGHSLQSDAELLLQSFTPLIQYGCSSALKPFLCAVYAPSCSENDIQATPCRSFCEMARKDCQSVLESFGFNWPASLECTEFPEQNCYDGGFLGGDVRYDEKDTGEAIGKQSCVPIQNPYCEGLYNTTRIPNLIGDTNQESAVAVMDGFAMFSSSPECYSQLLVYTCSMYSPPCSDGPLLFPCRSLCEAVATKCQEAFSGTGLDLSEMFACSVLPDQDCYEGEQIEIAPEINTGVIPKVEQQTCVPIQNPYCEGLYNTTRIPNLIGNTNQESAVAVMDGFAMFSSSPECYSQLLVYTCSMYSPPCSDGPLLFPCRSLCEAVATKCQEAFSGTGLDLSEMFACSVLPDQDCYEGEQIEIAPEINTGVIPPVEQQTCVPIQNPYCEGLYNTTRIPNLIGNIDQESAVAVMDGFAMFSSSPECYSQLLVYTCSMYSPPCSDGPPLFPCRSLCEAVATKCQEAFSGTGLDLSEMFACSLLPDQNCYEGEQFEIAPDIYINIQPDDSGPMDGYAVNVGVESGSNCVQIKPRRYDITTLGLSNYFRGWVDVQGQGAANDYCRVIRNSDGSLDLTCALAGTEGMSEFNYGYNFTAGDGTFVAGRSGGWYVRDENHDGRDDYCRCVYRDQELYVSCIPAMADGFMGDKEFRVEVTGCGVEQFDPFIGPRS